MTAAEVSGHRSVMTWEIERDSDVALVRMSGTKANVQNEAFFGDLHEAFDRLENEFDDCAVVLTADGPIFSAGIDFEDSFARIASPDHPAMLEWIRRYQATNLRIWRHPRPTVAAINGHAFAGGLITALDCDYRVTVPSATFSLNEVPIGIAMPAVYVEIIRYAVGDRVGALTSQFGLVYNATQALGLGLVHAVVPATQLLPAALEIARSVSPEAFEAYAFTKRAFQAPAFERAQTSAAQMDESLPGVLGAPAAVALRSRRYMEIKGRSPAWD